MGNTIIEKILMRHSGEENLSPGEIVTVEPNKMMVHDIYTNYLLDVLEEMETEKLYKPEDVVIIFDHLMPTAVVENDPVHYRAGLKLAEKYGIENLHIGEGICHSIMHEEKYAKPGEIVVATDSHTTTYGAAGCFSTGIGTTEMGAVLTNGDIWFKVPKAIKIELTGELDEGVLSKDIIMKILGDIHSEGGQYKSLEFTGDALSKLSMQARFTISNMALEAGAKCALFRVDQKTADYYDMNLKDIEWIKEDEDAEYEKVLKYNLNTLVPQVSCPQGVDNVHSISEVKGTKLHEVYIGSCTNGNLEDLKIAAEILEDKKIAKYMKFIVVPATNRVFKKAMEEGYIKTFIEAGGVVSHPGCALCCGMPYGLLSDNEAILSTANRNFIGRMGTKKSLIYLGSPAVAAASAIKGVITDPRSL